MKSDPLSPWTCARPHQITPSSGGSMACGRSRVSRVLKTTMTKDQMKQKPTITAERMGSVFQKQKHFVFRKRSNQKQRKQRQKWYRKSERSPEAERDNLTQSKSKSKSKSDSESRDRLYLYIDYRVKNPAAESESVPQNPTKLSPNLCNQTQNLMGFINKEKWMNQTK